MNVRKCTSGQAHESRLSSKSFKMNLKNAELHYFPDFFNKENADSYFKVLTEKISWKQDKIKLFGKEVLQPRLSAFFAEEGISYTYSGLQLKPEIIFPELLKIKAKIEATGNFHFNSCLANFYRDGKDSMGWHADDEKELGKNPVIASVNFGSERIFHLKHTSEPELKQKILLQHGSVLIMTGETQHFWKHQLPKTQKNIGPRLNLTFRKIIDKV